MKKMTSHIGSLGCDVIHSIKVQLEMKFNPDALQVELTRRLRGRHFEVKQDPECHARVLVITFSKMDKLDDLLDTLEDIEANVLAEVQRKRLLNLLD